MSATFSGEHDVEAPTVQKWNIGEKKPSGPSLELLKVIDQKGVHALV